MSDPYLQDQSNVATGTLTAESIEKCIALLNELEPAPVQYTPTMLIPISLVDPFMWLTESIVVRGIGNYVLRKLNEKFKWFRDKGVETYSYSKRFPKWIPVGEYDLETKLKTTKAMRRLGAPKEMLWSDWNVRFPRLTVCEPGYW